MTDQTYGRLRPQVLAALVTATAAVAVITLLIALSAARTARTNRDHIERNAAIIEQLQRESGSASVGGQSTPTTAVP